MDEESLEFQNRTPEPELTELNLVKPTGNDYDLRNEAVADYQNKNKSVVVVSQHHGLPPVRDKFYSNTKFVVNQPTNSQSPKGFGESDEMNEEENDAVNELSLENEERVDVFEQDPISGEKHLSIMKSYQLNAVADRVGVKLNLDERYFDSLAINAYRNKGIRLFKQKDFYSPADDEARSPQIPKNITSENGSQQSALVHQISRQQLSASKVSRESLLRFKTPSEKFEILGQYFGVTSIQIEKPVDASDHMKQIKNLLRRGTIVSHNPNRLREVIKILQKPQTKRAEKEVWQLVPLLRELKFFKERKPMSDEEMAHLSYNLHYENMDPGEIVFRQGDYGDKFYIILKGKVQVSIPDPLGQGLNEPKMQIQEVEEESIEQVEVKEPQKEVLTHSELMQLSPREQRKYRTKQMLSEILSCQNVNRTTMSPGEALNMASRVQSFMKLDSPTRARSPGNKSILKQQGATIDAQIIDSSISKLKETESIGKNGSAFMTDVLLKNESPTIRPNANRKIEIQNDSMEEPGGNTMLDNRDKAQSIDDQDTSGIHEIEQQLKGGVPIMDEDFTAIHDDSSKDPVDLLDNGFIDIARLTAGGSFGELALIDGKPRMATIKCLTRCHFMVLQKHDYANSLQEIDNKKKTAQVNFVKNIPLFSKLTRTFLSRLSYYFKPFSCTKDSYLYREGDVADKVFIIKEGEFIVTKKLIVKNKQTENIQEILDNPQRACKLQNKFFSKNSVKQIDKHTLAYVGPGNLIGEDDVIVNPQYTTTVKCISQNAKLIFIQKEDFMKLQGQQTTWALLMAMVKEKYQKFQDSLKHTTKARAKIDDNLKGISNFETTPAKAQTISGFPESQVQTRVPSNNSRMETVNVNHSSLDLQRVRDTSIGHPPEQTIETQSCMYQKSSTANCQTSPFNDCKKESMATFHISAKKGSIPCNQSAYSQHNLFMAANQAVNTSQPDRQSRALSQPSLTFNSNTQQQQQSKMNLSNPGRSMKNKQILSTIFNSQVFNSISQVAPKTNGFNKVRPQAALFMSRRTAHTRRISSYSKSHTNYGQSFQSTQAPNFYRNLPLKGGRPVPATTNTTRMFLGKQAENFNSNFNTTSHSNYGFFNQQSYPASGSVTGEAKNTHIQSSALSGQFRFVATPNATASKRHYGTPGNKAATRMPTAVAGARPKLIP